MKNSNLLERKAQPTIRWSAIRAALAGLAVAVGVQSASGFAIKGGFEVHQDITREALFDLDPITIRGFERRFTYSAISAIIEFNRLTDKDLESIPKAHFDNELIETSWKWVYVNRQRVLFELSQPIPNISQAHKWLGRALHTIQDFYSHSNYVELKFTTPLEFGTEHLPATLALNNPGSSVCSNSGNFVSGRGITTGHWLGGIRDAADTISQVPVPIRDSNGLLRCRHGFPGVSTGLNKDLPNLDGHSNAKDLAFESTKLYVRSILEAPELANKDVVRCMFMGISILDCVDGVKVSVYKLSASIGTPRYLNGTRTSVSDQGSSTRPWGPGTTSMVFEWAQEPKWHQTVCKIGDRWIAKPPRESVGAPSEGTAGRDCTGYVNRHTNTLTFALAEDGYIDGTRTLLTESDYTCPNRGIETQLSGRGRLEDVATYEFDLNTGAGSYKNTITGSSTTRRLEQPLGSSVSSAHGSLTWGAGELVPPLELLRTVPYTGDDQLPAECK